jgi:hypothetical protein
MHAGMEAARLIDKVGWAETEKSAPILRQAQDRSAKSAAWPTA